MKQFILEEQLDAICDKDGRDFGEIVEKEKKKSSFKLCYVFTKQIQAGNGELWLKMLKWRNLISLSTYVKYLEDFKFWVLAAGNAHRLPEKEIVKMFVSGLKSRDIS
jgi:hypothetical protein